MEQQKYIIAVDGGTQSTKMTIFDLFGNIEATYTDFLPPTYSPEPDIVEYPDDVLWDSFKKTSQELMKLFKGNQKDIIGLGLGSIRFCRAMLKKDGSLAYPVLSWMDSRVSEKYQPDNFQNVAYVTTTTGYLTQRLTGKFKDTAANYQGVWPIDTDTWNWYENDQLIAEYNLSREMLFELVKPGEKLGEVSNFAAQETGLPQGLPVFATANDKAVEALGAGAHKDNVLVVSLGTYIASMVVGAKNHKNAKDFWSNFGSEPNEYLYESNGIRRGMWMVSWFKNLLGQEFIDAALTDAEIPENILNKEAQLVPAGSDGLITVLDWLAPTDFPFRKGVLLGFDSRHTRAHIYRSILEAIAITIKNNASKMLVEAEQTVDSVVITGGGAKSDLFMQIFSDAFNLPVYRNRVSGAAATGAAICAAVGLGIYPDFGVAVEKMVHIQSKFEPNQENHDIYDWMNKTIFSIMHENLDPILEQRYQKFK